MASSTAKPMPQTIEAYKELAQRDHDLIVEMKAAHQAEVSKLKAKINKFEQRRYHEAFSGWSGYAWKDGVYIDDIDEYFNQLIN